MGKFWMIVRFVVYKIRGYSYYYFKNKNRWEVLDMVGKYDKLNFKYIFVWYLGGIF